VSRREGTLERPLPLEVVLPLVRLGQFVLVADGKWFQLVLVAVGDVHTVDAIVQVLLVKVVVVQLFWFYLVCLYF